ncbi:MAG: hypothetical protein V4724_40560 [Pseudomonadota bacterium]
MTTFNGNRLGCSQILEIAVQIESHEGCAAAWAFLASYGIPAQEILQLLSLPGPLDKLPEPPEPAGNVAQVNHRQDENA